MANTICAESGVLWSPYNKLVSQGVYTRMLGTLQSLDLERYDEVNDVQDAVKKTFLTTRNEIFNGIQDNKGISPELL